MLDKTKTNASTSPESNTEKKIAPSSTTLSTTIAFLKNLTMDERLNFIKIIDEEQSLANGPIGDTKDNQSADRSLNNSPELEHESHLCIDPHELVMQTSQLAERLRDAKMLSSQEAESEALMVYRLIYAATTAKVAGAEAVYNSLKERFTGKKEDVNFSNKYAEVL